MWRIKTARSVLGKKLGNRKEPIIVVNVDSAFSRWIITALGSTTVSDKKT